MLALPASEVMALPLWLLETDPKRFRAMIVLQLEARGLQPRGAEAVFDWSIVVQEPTRTLVLVGILPASLPEGAGDGGLSALRDVGPAARNCRRMPSCSGWSRTISWRRSREATA